VSDGGRAVLRDVSLRLHAGEVLGVYGLMGAGRTELLEYLLGLHPEAEGSVWLGARRIDGLPVPERIAAGLAMVPEDRQAAGLIPTLSVRDNITLSSLRSMCRGPYLSTSREDESASRVSTDLRIRHPGLGFPIGSLSGGNQQKAVIAKCLLTSPKVLLLDEPTRGVDVGAKGEIYAIVDRLAGSGMAIVFVSSELDEVRSVADRIMVLSRGAVTGEFHSGEATDAALASAASQ
jgi:erythritol transport system ATP-binding protein